jgi:hypothetical protein
MTPPPYPTPRCIPYIQATPHQISLALTYAMAALPEHFPTLSFASWTNGLLGLKPDLWVSGDTVSLDDHALQDLTQRLADAEELPELDPASYPYRGDYLSKRLYNYQDEALDALPDIATDPLAYGSRVFNLVVTLALGNSAADAVFHATHQGRRGCPGTEDPTLARATVHEQVRALRCARGEVGYQ